VELNQLLDVVKSLFTMGSGVIMPTARTLQTVLYCAEAIHLTWEAWSSGTRIVWAIWYIYMANNTLETCNSPELPLCLRRMAACMLVTSVAGIVMILPEGRLIEAIGHCAQVARYRALERPDLADLEAKKCVEKVVAAARLAAVGAMSYFTAEFVHYIFWFIGWMYSFEAGPECGGPMYFAWFNMRPFLPSAFKASMICILLFKHPQAWFKRCATMWANP
jgi:hypothetical protein